MQRYMYVTTSPYRPWLRLLFFQRNGVGRSQMLLDALLLKSLFLSAFLKYPLGALPGALSSVISSLLSSLKNLKRLLKHNIHPHTNTYTRQKSNDNNFQPLRCLQVAIVHHLDMPIMRQRAFHIAPGTENQIPITPTLYTANPQVKAIQQKNKTFLNFGSQTRNCLTDTSVWLQRQLHWSKTNYFVEIAKFQKILSNCPSKSKSKINLDFICFFKQFQIHKSHDIRQLFKLFKLAKDKTTEIKKGIKSELYWNFTHLNKSKYFGHFVSYFQYIHYTCTLHNECTVNVKCKVRENRGLSKNKLNLTFLVYFFIQFHKMHIASNLISFILSKGADKVHSRTKRLLSRTWDRSKIFTKVPWVS